MRVIMRFEAFSGLFGVFDDSPKDTVMRSSKNLAEGTQRVRVSWTTTRKLVDS